MVKGNYIQGIIAAIIFIAIYTAEHLYPQRKEIIDYKHELFNFLIGVANELIMMAAGFFTVYIISLGEQSQFGLLRWVELPLLVNYIIGFVLLDFWMYCWHRANHGLGLLWYFHRFHHLDTKLNSTSALRFHTGELLLSVIFRAVFIALVGINFSLLIVYSTVLFFVIVLHHSNIKISQRCDLMLRKLIVSPHMHRIHHSVIRAETDSNYSSVFPYWDMLFNSYNKFPQQPVEFGVEEIQKINHTSS